ncbi:MAG: PhoH family protein [Rhizobiales bacterium]|nr:PhoH family protein [Hyphomicrobiales bacterium]
MKERVIAFEDNRLASDLFGQYDQNLALLEQRLGVEAVTRGNQVTLRGTEDACDHAHRTLETLYEQLTLGRTIDIGEVEGVIRMVADEKRQLVLPTLEKKASVKFAQISTRKKTIFARTKTQDDYIRAMEKRELVFGVGPAGTGKTYLACAFAAALLERGEVDRLILSRPAVEAGERLGFLPGDMKEKVDPYLRPLYDALYDMMLPERVERALTSGAIEIAPLAFMRGRTLAHSAVILDEAQNTTSMQMKMFLTRLGEGSRMFITGDPSQIDLPRGVPSGLIESLRILKAVPGISQVTFQAQDVVRHELVARIVNAYDGDAQHTARLGDNNGH